MKNFINKIHYAEDLPIYLWPIRLVLSFASIFYTIGINVINFLYAIGILRQEKIDAIVISIGNLTTGGTGKTPITAAIAKLCVKSGKKTAILSRGYGGSLSSNEVQVVSNGEESFLTAEEAGDEPFWLASNVKKTAVIMCKDRLKAAKWAQENLGIELFILDDGYQYRKLKRDLNIMLVDGHKKFGNEKLLPEGPLREPKREGKRADKIIVVNKLPYSEQSVKDCKAYAIHLIKTYDKEVFGCNVGASSVNNAITGVPIMNPRNTYAFTGIAQPESFFAAIKAFNHNLLGTKEFDDHHAYTEKDIQEIINDAKSIGAEIIITTEKDIVKISSFFKTSTPEIPICVLKQGVEMDFASLLQATIEY